MRFRLSALLMVVTLLAIGLGMVIDHGVIHGLILFVPHLLAICAGAVLLRCHHRRIAAVGAAVYAGCWLITALLGVPSVRSTIQTQFLSRPFVGSLDDVELKRVAYQPPRPWQEMPPNSYYICNESSPCPFVVSLEFGAMSDRSGYGGRVYFVWFFGLELAVTERFMWQCC